MTAPPFAAEVLMARAAGRRHGAIEPVRAIPTTRSDIAGIHHASVSSPAARDHTAAGGVGWTRQEAEAAALGEALERYAAAVFQLETATIGLRVPIEEFSLHSDAQRSHPEFPYAAAYRSPIHTRAWRLADNEGCRVPSALVGLSDPSGHGVATSSGLAAAATADLALLRATQEVVERDALMTTWNYGLAGRQVPIGDRYHRMVDAVGGSVTAIDATPAYSPHPVALVCGWATRRGRRCPALGAACRASWAEAVDKAFLEWAQGVLFAGVMSQAGLDRRYRRPAEVRTFADHALYYTANPRHWPRIALLADPTPQPPPPDGPSGLGGLVAALTGAGVRLFYRDLTTPDVGQVGVTVVRVLSPDLTPIHADHRWPPLGGRAADLAWRYPGAGSSRSYPNPAPHPLG